ncbi:MAG: GNAT family N-acetyltransferase [Flavobacteriales bacterium]|nr:GNAT family N-acetyltransferase [Flavobacteriales bacterium]
MNSETAEQVRVWRNSPEVSSQMEYRDFISTEMQQKWLERIQNNRYAYFMIYSDQVQVGMIHLAQINSEEKTAESGLFIGNLLFIGTGVALAASLLLLDYAFDTLGLETIRAKVKQDNIQAEQYNRLLGFQKTTETGTGFYIWELSRQAYTIKRPKLTGMLA